MGNEMIDQTAREIAKEIKDKWGKAFGGMGELKSAITAYAMCCFIEGDENTTYSRDDIRALWGKINLRML
jgi:hypothetical protein